MKYKSTEFTEELKNEIAGIEAELERYVSAINLPGLVYEFDRTGQDPFTPDYHSSVSIGYPDQEEDVHTITIWQCERYFLGLPISSNIPGSKIVGELMDETVEEAKEEIQELIAEWRLSQI